MKIFRLCGLVLLSLLIAFSISSCVGDEEPTPNPTPTPTPAPTAAKIEIPASEDTKPVFSTEGGKATVTFTASQAWTATAANTRADDWLGISPTSGGAGTAMLTITTAANDTYDERAATITIKSGTASQTILVTQRQKDALTVGSDKVEVDANGREIVVEVKTNIEFSVKTDADWITHVGTRALRTEKIHFNIAANGGEEERSGTIVIAGNEISQTIKVSQRGRVYVTDIVLDNTSLEMEVGDTVTLVATILPANADNKGISWSSDNASIASVDTEGKVRALAEGSATITVMTVDGGKTATCHVNVKEPSFVNGNETFGNENQDW